MLAGDDSVLQAVAKNQGLGADAIREASGIHSRVPYPRKSGEGGCVRRMYKASGYKSTAAIGRGVFLICIKTVLRSFVQKKKKRVVNRVLSMWDRGGCSVCRSKARFYRSDPPLL